MKKTRKELLLYEAPPVPLKYAEMMKGKRAKNFVVFLTRGNELFARCFHRYTDGEIVERQRFVFAKDGAVRYGYDEYNGWSIRTKFREPVFCKPCYGFSFDNSYTVLNWGAISRSCMKYSMAESYNGCLLMQYMRLYCRHPNLEYLMKSGYSVLINEHEIDYWGWSSRIYVDGNINWKSNDLLKMLRLNRTEFALLKGSEKYYDKYINWRERFPQCKPGDLLSMAKFFGTEYDIVSDCCHRSGLTPQRLARYLKDNKVRLRDYNDYLDQCTALEYDMQDTAICMPKDFDTVHERLSSVIKYKHINKHQKLLESRLAERKALEFEFGKLCVRQPLTADEIIQEGATLHHCVGGYAERHALGKLHILFIRRTDKPDTPYYTMEVSTSGNIVQVRGNRNRDPGEEVNRLLEQYRKHLSELFKKARKSA